MGSSLEIQCTEPPFRELALLYALPSCDFPLTEQDPACQRFMLLLKALLLSYAIILNSQSCPELSLFLLLPPSVTYSLIKTANPAIFMLGSHYSQEKDQLSRGCPLLRL